ncbi:30S ribosomal protein S4 [bacterium]|nr:30S ribosomal protein S4 [bacterium]
MARYTGPVCRICRREGQKLFLKGQRCYGPKCAWEKKQYPPGQSGQAAARRRRVSDYGKQMREKQKLRALYGVLEKPFRKYVAQAERMSGVAGENVLKLLEMRLDNVVYRAGFAASRAEARQLISHGHFTVDGRITNVASFRVKPGHSVKVKDADRDLPPIVAAAEAAGGRSALAWLQTDLATRQVTMLAIPERAEIDTDVNEQMIIEFYSR